MKKTVNEQVKSALEQIDERDLYSLLIEMNELLHKIYSNGIGGEIKIVNILGSNNDINANLSD